jgi:hypothetical protein
VPAQFAFGADDNRPGYRALAGDAALRDARAAARDAREIWIKDLTSAWKRTPSTYDAGEPDAGEVLLKRHLRSEPDDNAQALRERAYRNYCDELSRAWQRTDPGAATAIEQQRRTYTYEGGRWGALRP